MQQQETAARLAAWLPFWNTLDQKQQDILIDGTAEITFEKGQLVHSPSEQCVGMLLVERGQVRTYLLSEGGREVTLFRLGAGDTCILSASCVLSSITFDVFIDAQEDTTARLISSQALEKVQKASLAAENFCLQLTAERFSDVMWAMEQILFMRFDARLAVFLLDETAKTGAENLTITHEQIARFIGSAREVVSRMLKYFETEGMVRLHRGGIEIVDKAALREVVSAKGK